MREKLTKIGAKIVRHGRYVTFQLAEVAIPKALFAEILRRIDGLRPPPLAAMTGLDPDEPGPSARTRVCGVGRVRPQRAKWPLKTAFDRQIRPMNRRQRHVPGQIRGRLLAQRPLC